MRGAGRSERTVGVPKVRMSMEGWTSSSEMKTIYSPYHILLSLQLSAWAVTSLSLRSFMQSMRASSLWLVLMVSKGAMLVCHRVCQDIVVMETWQPRVKLLFFFVYFLQSIVHTCSTAQQLTCCGRPVTDSADEGGSGNEEVREFPGSSQCPDSLQGAARLHWLQVLRLNQSLRIGNLCWWWWRLCLCAGPALCRRQQKQRIFKYPPLLQHGAELQN